MTGDTCPCCNSEMGIQGDVANGQLQYCDYCFGILASDRWLSTNMRQPVLRNLRNAVFNGVPAGYKCPTCDGGMVKGPATTGQGASIEVDGCLKCGSLWFDNREIGPFVPDIEDNLPNQRGNDGSGDRHWLEWVTDTFLGGLLGGGGK